MPVADSAAGFFMSRDGQRGAMNRLHPATTRRETTCTDVGNADIAGANICHPWWLNTRILAGDGRCGL